MVGSRPKPYPRETLELIKHLQEKLPDETFRRLHHMQSSMAAFRKYCDKTQSFREEGANHQVHKRLKYMLDACVNDAPPPGKSFETLADEALKRFPIERRGGRK